MSTGYDEYLGKVPAYLAGRMTPEEREDFENFATQHPELQREIDDLRPAVGWLASEFESAGRTHFRLSPSRRASMRRETDVNIVSFPQMPARAVAKTGTMRRISGSIAVAASLLVALYVGLDFNGKADPLKAPAQMAAETQIRGPVDESPVRVYVYPPGYGLDKPEPWRMAGSIGFASERIHDDSPSKHFWAPTPWQPSFMGLDGPRPYYGFSTLRGPGAI